MKSRSKKLLLPPPDRPIWKGRSVGDLIYLGWGQRQYGRHPIEMTRHPGWAYLVVLEGKPTLTTPSGNLQFSAGDLVLVHRDHPTGWTDEDSAPCRILSWIWAHAPDPMLRHATPRKLLRGRAHNALLRELVQLHRACHREVAYPLPGTAVALAGMRGLLDAHFIRATTRHRSSSTNRIRVELAINWMRENLHVRNPSERLCEYLGVSPATLNRLFRDVMRVPCTEYYRRMRMEAASEYLLQRHWSLKKVAYSLGFRHANDCSRAFRRHFGCTASAHVRSTASSSKVTS